VLQSASIRPHERQPAGGIRHEDTDSCGESRRISESPWCVGGPRVGSRVCVYIVMSTTVTSWSPLTASASPCSSETKTRFGPGADGLCRPRNTLGLFPAAGYRRSSCSPHHGSERTSLIRADQ